jgi:hypothetical protein
VCLYVRERGNVCVYVREREGARKREERENKRGRERERMIYIYMRKRMTELIMNERKKYGLTWEMDNYC